MGIHVRTNVVTGVLAAAVVVLAAGCGSGGTPGSRTASSSPAGQATTTAPASSAPASSAPANASCDRSAWQSAPVTVDHSVPVPPVPVVTAVRTAQHPECGYDRLVLDITGPTPSYSLRYVTQVTRDGSGEPITLPGQDFLLITLRPAQAHSAAGTPTISSQVQLPGYPMLQSWVLAGDYEGVVTIAVGLRDHVSVRAGELPGHLYIDVKE